MHDKMHNQVAYRSRGSILVDEKSSNTCIANLNVGPGLQGGPMLSPSGKSVLFWLDSSYDCLWNINTQTVYRLQKLILPSPMPLSCFLGRHWSPDGHYIAIGRKQDFTIWDTCTGVLVSILTFDSFLDYPCRKEDHGP